MSFISSRHAPVAGISRGCRNRMGGYYRDWQLKARKHIDKFGASDAVPMRFS